MTIGNLDLGELSTAFKAVIAGITFIVTATIGWLAKADKADVARVELRVDSLQMQLRDFDRILERLDDRTERVDRFICRQIPHDLGCP